MRNIISIFFSDIHNYLHCAVKCIFCVVNFAFDEAIKVIRIVPTTPRNSAQFFSRELSVAKQYF